MFFLSSNAFSTDDQTRDVLNYLELSDSVTYELFNKEFPEYDDLVWGGSWVDTEASGVDTEYMEWVRYWIESNTDIQWCDGEPVIVEDDDELEY